MRKIEKLMIEAIHGKKSKTLDNTRVEYLPELDTPTHARIEHSKIYLYENHIATYCHVLNRFDYNQMTLAAWPTSTTKSRLRALGFDVQTKKGHIFVGSKQII